MRSGHGVRVAIIGDSDAGIAAALRCRELAPDADVTVLVADAYPNYSICGLPYYIAGDVPDWRALAHRSRDELERTGMTLHRGVPRPSAVSRAWSSTASISCTPWTTPLPSTAPSVARARD